MFGRSRNYFQEIKHMKELKADDPTDERADILNTAADQQPSFRESAIRPSSSDPSRQLRQLPRRQYQFGPPLADGYAPESATPVQKPMPQRERQTPGSSLGRSPSRNSPGDKKIVKLSAAVRQEIERELAYVRAAWQKYRSTNSRDAVYFYLESVFSLVTRWQRLNCSLKNSRAALCLKPRAPKMKPEPFGIVIYCTADLEVADAKTRSKWSRVLRYARKAKPANQSVTEFIKTNGGINACARRFALGTD